MRKFLRCTNVTDSLVVEKSILSRYVLELSSRLSTKRFPRNLGAQRFHLSSSRKASSSGKNGIPGSNPVVKPDASKVTPPPPPLPPVGKPDGSEDSNEISSSVDDKAETQPEVSHSEASEGIQSDIEVQLESDLTHDRYTYISSNQEETPQESVIDRAEKNLPISSDDNSATEDSITKSDTPAKIISEAGNVSLEVVQKPEDNTVISAQSSSVDRESNMDSASPKDPDTEKSFETGVEREAEVLDSLLKEYNLEGNDTESNGSSSSGEQLIKETELVLEFLGAIHAAENRQAHLDAHVFAEELQALKRKKKVDEEEREPEEVEIEIEECGVGENAETEAEERVDEEEGDKDEAEADKKDEEEGEKVAEEEEEEGEEKGEEIVEEEEEGVKFAEDVVDGVDETLGTDSYQVCKES
ncbi:unnamed protein product [Cochlearia groenlandica]